MARILVHPTHDVLIIVDPEFAPPVTIDCRRCTAHGAVEHPNTDNWRLDAPCGAFDAAALFSGLCLSLEFGAEGIAGSVVIPDGVAEDTSSQT